MAEEVGFEPTELSFNGFQDRRLQPLGHSSAIKKMVCTISANCCQYQELAAVGFRRAFVPYSSESFLSS